MPRVQGVDIQQAVLFRVARKNPWDRPERVDHDTCGRRINVGDPLVDVSPAGHAEVDADLGKRADNVVGGGGLVERAEDFEDLFREEQPLLRRQRDASVFSVVVLGESLVEVLQIDTVLRVVPNDVLAPREDPHVECLRHVGRMWDEEDHCDIVPPQRFFERLHRVSGAAIEDEDGAVIEGAKRFGKHFSPPHNFREKNVTEPLAENFIVDEAIFGVVDLEVV